MRQKQERHFLFTTFLIGFLEKNHNQSVRLFHTKIMARLTESSHQDCGTCYLHLPIFFLYMHSPVLLECKKFF